MGGNDCHVDCHGPGHHQLFCRLLKIKCIMRTITLIVIHCSAVRPDQTSSAAQIDTWHRRQGWKLGIGYHYVIRRNGEIEPGSPEYMVGAHCRNHNAHSIGICYEGGLE